MAVTRLALMVGSVSAAPVAETGECSSGLPLCLPRPPVCSSMASTDKCTYVYQARTTDLGFCTSRYVHTWSRGQQMTMAMVLLLLLLTPASLFTLSLCAAGRASAVRHSAGLGQTISLSSTSHPPTHTACGLTRRW